MADYERLTALDNSFLLMESPSSYTHVASTLILDAGPLRLEDGGIDFDAIVKAHQAVLHRIPRYRQVLKWVPIFNQPVWVDDPHFDLGYHLRHTSLPRPGSERQLKRLSARIMEQHLDRARPLWETWVVEGLEGDRFALISKVHHCMIDGVSGVDLLMQLLQQTPDAVLPPAADHYPREVPSGATLLRDEVLRRAQMPFDMARSAFRLATSSLSGIEQRASSIGESIGAALRSPSVTPINERISPHRRFDWIPVQMADVKRIRKGLGGSVNDVVLATVAGAFRRFFEVRGCDPGELDFRVLTPVSVRSESERGTLGNRVSGWMVDMPLGESDPCERLARIREQTEKLKATSQADDLAALTDLADLAPANLMALGARNMSRFLPVNTVVTNVPGPPIPMFLLGARLLEIYPHVPLIDRLGLGIALMSYDGALHWGVNADRELVPDVHAFIEALGASFDELLQLALEATATVVDADAVREAISGQQRKQVEDGDQADEAAAVGVGVDHEKPVNPVLQES